MKAVIDKSTNIVTFAFFDSDYVELTETRLLASDITALDVNETTHTLKSVPDNHLFVGGLWRWSEESGWECTNTQRLIEAIGPQIYEEVQEAIQSMLDAKSREYEYDSIHTACGWAGVLEDATALKAWGAACWNTSKQLRSEVLSGTRDIMTAEEVMSEMPEFVIGNYV